MSPDVVTQTVQGFLSAVTPGTYSADVSAAVSSPATAVSQLLLDTCNTSIYTETAYVTGANSHQSVISTMQYEAAI